jgi:hypothetical protein
MVDIGPHIRIFEPSPTDEFVTKRQAAIKDIAAKFVKPNQVDRLLSVANGVALASSDGGKMPADLAAEVTASITAVSPSFVADGHDLEITVCAMLAISTAIQSGAKTGMLTNADYLAVGLWSGMSWLPGSRNEAFERLRSLLLDQSRQHVLKAGTLGRTRASPPRPVQLTAENENLSKVVDNLRSTIERLTTNAAVDREEIDLLWWSIAGWSDVLENRYVDLQPHAAAIALGLDAAKRLRRMPLDLHKALVLRRVPEAESLTLTQLVKTLGDDRGKLGVLFGTEALVVENPHVFPLLGVLASGSVKGSGKGRYSPSDLASRALLEAVTFDVINRREV